LTKNKHNKKQFHLGLEGTLLCPLLCQIAPSGSMLKLLFCTQEYKLDDPEIKVTHNPISFGKLRFFLATSLAHKQIYNVELTSNKK